MRRSGWLTFSSVVLITAGIMRRSLIYIVIAIMVIYGLSARYGEQPA